MAISSIRVVHGLLACQWERWELWEKGRRNGVSDLDRSRKRCMGTT